MNKTLPEKFENDQTLQKISKPTLMIMSGKDNNVCNHAIERGFKKIGSQDKTLLGYDEVDHYIW